MRTFKELVKDTIRNLEEIQERASKYESSLNNLSFYNPTLEPILENYSEDELDEIYTCMDNDLQADQEYLLIDEIIHNLRDKLKD